MANFDETKDTLELIKKEDPNITFCISTNGLLLPRYAGELVKLGVTHFTITINAVDEAVGALIYKKINYGCITYKGKEAAEILLSKQLEGIQVLRSYNTKIKVNTVYIKGINDKHIEDIVLKVRDMGCFVSNIMPMIPVIGSDFELFPRVNENEINDIREKCSNIMPQMMHCKQCRADAIGLLV